MTSTTARRSTSRYRRLASLLGQLAFPHAKETEVVEVIVSELHAPLVGQLEGRSRSTAARRRSRCSSRRVGRAAALPRQGASARVRTRLPSLSSSLGARSE